MKVVLFLNYVMILFQILKTTFKNLAIRFFLVFFFLLSHIALGQDKSIILHANFSDTKNSISAKTIVFKLKYKNTGPFVMLSGYTDDISFNNTVYYRLKTDNTWSSWNTFLEPHDGNDSDRVVLGEIFIEHAFDDIQFKTDNPTETNFTFRLFFPDFTKNITKERKENKHALKNCVQPTYLGRNDWCPAGNCPKSSSPSIINPTHIVIHHSAGQTISSDYAAVVRAYWDFHVNTRGWSDIGYNWLVDPNGILYEGRGDRIRGAHSPCMNHISTGICFIGNYENFQPSNAGLSTLKDFIAWDATSKDIDIKTSSYVSGLGIMDHLSGHKDGKINFPSSSCSSTLCPGNNLHSKIGTIKNDVAMYSCYITDANVPKTPTSFSVISTGVTSVEVKIRSVANATKYAVYKSADNINYQKVEESSLTSFSINNLTQGQVSYFKVEAVNNEGSSEKSSALAAISSQYISDILIIDGVERRQFSAIAQYDYPLSKLGRTFSSATNDAVQDGTVNLNNFKIVIWMLMDESSVDDTFNESEQNMVKNFIDNGGVFIVSGDEIGWDLVYLGNTKDKSFYEDYLKAEYIADIPAPNNKRVRDINNTVYNLDDGSHGTINSDYPDLIKPKNGSTKSFTYDGVNESNGIAGVSSQTASGGVEYLGFSIELVYDNSQRKDLLEYILLKYSSLLDVDNTFINQNIALYPNPTSGILKISNSKSIQIRSIEVYNVYGQKLNVKYYSNVLDIKNLKNGLYFVMIEDENGYQGTFKIIKR